MKKLLLTLICCLCAAASLARTAAADSVTVSGNVLDALSREYLDSVRVELFEVPSMRLVSSTTIVDWTEQFADPDERRKMAHLYPAVKRRVYWLQATPGTFLLRFTRNRYKEKEVDITIPQRRYGRRTETWDVKNVLLDRDHSRLLSEAVVQATKIKMMTKGDTVVFNADAFQVADGSMLDALVDMMPGLEVRAGGKIYHNGTYVPELLLNGKEFFSGDPAVALKNLPAYTVKHLRVYHRAPNDAYLRKNWTHEDTLSWKKVLDVRLKKQYSTGWIANAEVAGGPAFAGDGGVKPVWLTRLFGLYFADHVRLGVFANCNNNNDTGLASSDGDWYSSWTPDPGVTTMELGGIDVNVDGKKAKIFYNANLQGAHEVTESERVVSASTFLPSGDVFNRSRSTGRFDRYHLVWKNHIQWNAKKASVSFRPSVEYFRRYNDSRSLSAQFSDDPVDASRAASLDSIFLPATSPRLQQLLVNRVEQNSSTVNDVWWQWAFLNTSFVDPLLGGDVRMSLTQKYQQEDPREMQQYNLWRADQTTFQHRQTLTPSRFFFIDADVNYQFPKWGILHSSLYYGYKKNYTRNSRELRVESDAEPLPSVSDWQTVAIDAANSFRAERNTDHHRLCAHLRLQTSKHTSLSLYPAVEVDHGRRTDTRGEQREVSRRDAFFCPTATFYYRYRPLTHEKNARRGTISFNYDIDISAPDLSYLLDIRDTSDPLRITLGNAGLRNTYKHGVGVKQSVYLTRRSISSSLYYGRSDHQVAQGMSYNPQTGVYTYRPENVEGNWYLRGSLNMTFSPTNSRFTYNTSTNLQYRNSVDLISPDGMSDATRSVVRNMLASEELGVAYSHKNITAKAHGKVDWNGARSERQNFNPRSSFDIFYGATFTANNFLWGFSFTTDLNMRHRRGYDDSSMNDNSLVWDAQLSRSFGKSKAWNLRLKGHDILRQLSNVQRTLNSQGLTETWVNSLPAYLMLHVSYRLNR